MNIQDIISESTENDLFMNKIAYEAAYTVGRKIYDGTRPEALIEFENTKLSEYGEFLLYSAPSVGLTDYPNLAIMFAKFRPDAVGISGGVWNLSEKILDKYEKCLIIFGLRSVSENEVKFLTSSTKFYDTFYHEFIHILDGYRSNEKMPNSESSDHKSYYNNSSEFNAYYHGICSNLMNCINQIKHNNDQDISNQDMLSLYHFTGDFKTDLKRIMSPSGMHETLFLKWLTDDRRKTLLKRIFKLYQELLKLIKT